VRTDRRGFVQLVLGALGALALPGGAARAKAPSLAIHHITGNTRLGAIGRGLFALRFAPPPKDTSDRPRVALPEWPPGVSRGLATSVRERRPAPAFRGEQLPFATLARLLQQTNGVTGAFGSGPGATRLRAAPSAGALYAGEVYVVAERVANLAPGLYYYDVLERALVRLREGHLLGELAQVVEEPSRLRGAAFAVILSNVFGRYTARYANRGYRYALIDTGHIAENLRLAAEAEGLGEAGFERFCDERLDALLGVDGRAEAACALSAVGLRGEPVAVKPARRLVEADPRAALAPGRSFLRYHAASRLVVPDGEGAGASASPDAAGGEATPTAPAAIALEPRADTTLSVEAAIRARRSALLFREEAIAGGDLALALDLAQRPHAPDLELHVAVHRVNGVPPGLYASEGARLLLRRGGDLRAPLVDACLGQEKAGEVAAAFFVVARPAEVAARKGPRSYRDLLVESGRMAQRLYLAAEAMGLAARNLAAFRDAELNALLGFGEDGRVVLHLTLLGREG
jgi:SagB-type dehydrogenase family enzyme